MQTGAATITARCQSLWQAEKSNKLMQTSAAISPERQ